MIEKIVTEICKNAKEISYSLANATTRQKNEALYYAAQELEDNVDEILEENDKDLDSLPKGTPKSYQDRLYLNDNNIAAMADTLRDIAARPDPIKKILDYWKVPSGLLIERVTTPLGVMGVIFESRPNVCIDAGALCLKSSNPVILRCGSDSFHTCNILVDLFKHALRDAGLNHNAIQLIPFKEHEAVDIMLKMEKYIDVLVPRGGKRLIEKVSQSRIPMLKHLNGICHTYVHKAADLNMAIEIVLNAKLRRVSICGATETLLIDRDWGDDKIRELLAALWKKGCALRVDQYINALIPQLPLATEEDWGTEYLDKILSVKTVNSVGEAVTHIRTYGSSHTDAIVTASAPAAEEFLNNVDSAVVMKNASTQFSDGGEFGMGAEIGISTGRLHARGPVGLEQLCTFKYVVRGTGQTRS
ncbi:Gamma-glutamyl phosphate reductase [Elusimicrobium minutum Pei191]|uniref:Gamma-glutamyl phosphate reductase n=1 Tax=Elusimicrobium minutum (strain Pei191) TaxID=445932 RepID=B2KEI6_ELUMP|nr:glutamate-5-semialdehyde dehydrogenase [Elusimicrobium minutum]ACC98932.1 Gamma-glutamyl phosphate reductase [Elusimicrobium minutum Pei191]